MRVIQVKATAGADGRLLLDIPTGVAGAHFDVAVVLHGLADTNGTGTNATHQPSPELMRTCGVIDDDTFDALRPTDLPPVGKW